MLLSGSQMDLFLLSVGVVALTSKFMRIQPLSKLFNEDKNNHKGSWKIYLMPTVAPHFTQKGWVLEMCYELILYQN